MISEYSKRLIIISKKCLDDEQNEKLAEFLKKNVKEGDIVFTMGAGDVVNINKLIVE